MISTLKGVNYNDNKAEMIINLKDKQFDGEMRKVIFDINFKFGIRCSESSAGLREELIQEISQEILWTEYDINTLVEQVDNIFKNPSETKPSLISLFEYEFNALYFYYEQDDLVDVFISVGVDGYGPGIRLLVTKNDLLLWVNEIKDYFYK